MSYSCFISFKTIESEELFPFFVQLKNELKNKLPEIASDNFLYSPFSSKNVEYNEEFQKENSKARREIFKEVYSWAKDCFQYRWFYLPEHKLLGIFGLPNYLYNLFDNTSHFQNSVDQDYEFSYWNGIPLFESIAQKWLNASEEFVIQKGRKEDWWREEYYTSRPDRIACLTRKYAYDEIWQYFKGFLYNDSNCVSIALADTNDFDVIKRFSNLCLEKYNEWNENISKQIEEGKFDDLIKATNEPKNKGETV